MSMVIRVTSPTQVSGDNYHVNQQSPKALFGHADFQEADLSIPCRILIHTWICIN